MLILVTLPQVAADRDRGLRRHLIKMGRRIKELERLYGVREGSHGEKRGTNCPSNLTQEDLAEKLGVNLKTLRRAEKLASLPQEVQDIGGDRTKLSNGQFATQEETSDHKWMYPMDKPSDRQHQKSTATLMTMLLILLPYLIV